MSKNIVIVIIIAVIVGGLMFILVQQYATQKQESVIEVTTRKVPVKPAVKEAFVGGIEVATTTQQEIQNIDLGDVKGDFKAVDADINSL